MQRIASAFVLVGGVALAASATGCAAQSSRGDNDRPAPGLLRAQCDAGPAQTMLGQTASAAVGARLLALTNARQLRWAPPDSAITMDFRPDRLTVSYDREMRITRISCG